MKEKAGYKRAYYDHALIFISTLETESHGIGTKIFDSNFNWLNQISLTDKKFSVHLCK